jgi:hypothetical protein
MRTYKKVTKKVEDRVYCDICSSSCITDNFGSEYATLEALWGYGSQKDGEKFDIQMCEKCFNDILIWMTNKRQEYLAPFAYPHDKDPLKGQT